MYDIYIINLLSSPERKENIANQLNAINVPFTFFPAIDGRKEAHPLFKKYDDQCSQLYRGRSLNKGQLGCYASHYLLWEKCAEKGEPIIVLEDDAIISPIEFKAFCTSATSLNSQFKFIRLHKHQRKRFSSKKATEIDKLEIHRFSKGHMGTIGYFLTPSGAKKLLEHSQHWFLPVDIFMDRFWITKIDSYGTIPPCLSHDDSYESNIGYVEYEKRAKRHLYTKIRREGFNLSEAIKRTIHNAIFNLTKKRK
ncbi:glycosyltransferase family 25 protein [Photobacterium profundum]|nr:glycosyltransferase family 25 protein [Photobacterium profundum]